MNGRHFALQISNGRFRAVKQKADLFQHAPQSVSADHILIRVASSKSTSSKYDAVYIYAKLEDNVDLLSENSLVNMHRQALKLMLIFVRRKNPSTQLGFMLFALGIYLGIRVVHLDMPRDEA
ncbi:hypothetical protein M0804_000815 [Polistes exclamans]|nr:hypothetical protein M0804_000815 [Polistes exclamans]